MTEKLTLIPPETRYISSKYVLRVPVNDNHLNNPWELRLYASELVNRQIGDEVQLTSLKIKKPGLISRSLAKLLKKPAEASLYVTIKF